MLFGEKILDYWDDILKDLATVVAIPSVALSLIHIWLEAAGDSAQKRAQAHQRHAAGRILRKGVMACGGTFTGEPHPHGAEPPEEKAQHRHPGPQAAERQAG